MRQIKFRGKRVDNSEWVYGHYMPSLGTQERIFTVGMDAVKYDQNREEYLYNGLGFQVDPETIGQFTGLQDKNGTDIYEGDICRTFRGREYEVFWNQTELQWVFKYIKPISHVKESYEVIGTIHDTEPIKK